MRGTVAPVVVYERDLSIVPPDMELALMFALMEYDRRRHEQYRTGSYAFFSKLLWPLALIQAGSEKYIGIDGLSLFDLDFKITRFLEPLNPLLTKLNGLDIKDHASHIAFLNQLSSDLNAPLKEKLRIKGILGPEILHGLVPLIKLATDKPIDSIKMETDVSTDSLIEITNQYNRALKTIEETISKWHTLQQRIEQKLAEWQASYAHPPSSTENEAYGQAYKILKKRIQDKIWDCRNEIDYLLHWALSGRTLNLVVPIMEIWIPMYLAAINLPNQSASRYLILPPAILSEKIKVTRWVPLDSFHSSFHSIFKDQVETILNSQSSFTAKIKNVCQTQNLFLMEEANKLITRGFNRLREKNLIENKYIEALQNQWQTSSQNLKNE